MSFFIIFFLISTLGYCPTTIASDLETYIVRVESPESRISTQSSVDLDDWYNSFLPATTVSVASTSNGDGETRMVYSYHNVMKGFAAKLSAEEVEEMSKKKGFISARPQRVLPLHTTHTPSFLGLQQNFGFWEGSSYGKGVIIGVLDTGIALNHPSFSDQGVPPPPPKWKGVCEPSFAGACNNKLIGARSFQTGNRTPKDDDGHGTHTAGTAAGSPVRGANVYGGANGTAVGLAPLAHLAIYKVCWVAGCSDSDILAAMDVAVDDGVDILSLSIGGFSPFFHDDSIAIGAYAAMEKGIFVSASAGNDGPVSASLSNDAPWILTVGASTLDRKLRATAMLGNGEQYDGESVFAQEALDSTRWPLVYPGQDNEQTSTSFCRIGSLSNAAKIRGKIVVCRAGGGVSRTSKGREVKRNGGLGMILIETEEYGVTTIADAHVLPTVDVTYKDGQKIIAYINSTPDPVATIAFRGTVIGDENAPIVGAFSSRGPSRASPGILKPDIIGPGVNILAAWPTSVENTETGANSATFNVLSGTSMSCPHLSGVAALLKSSHPEWSPAMIKSAIMTTADILNLGKNPIQDERLVPADVFATGAGHVNPSRANDPGLVYDTRPQDYLPYLCGLNYTNGEVKTILQRPVNCSEVTVIPEAQLNYPSFSIVLGPTARTYTRTVTNVGEAKSSYTVDVVEPQGVKVDVEPQILEFSEVNEKLMYNVTFSLSEAGFNRGVVQGYLRWKSAKHVVSSPIAAILS